MEGRLVDALDGILERLDQAHEDFEAGRLVMARRSTERVLRRIRRTNPSDGAPVEVEALTLLASILTEQGEFSTATECFAEIKKLLPSGIDAIDTDAFFTEARFHLARWDMKAAAEALERCQYVKELEPRLEDMRGHLAMFAGEFERGREHYRKAHSLDPKGCPLPAEMSDDEAAALLDEVFDALPEDIRNALVNVQMDLVFLPDPETDASADLHPEILGVYQGVPLTEKSVFDPVMAPDRIRIFKHNLERFAMDRETLITELRITLLHEIGHHLGWDEDDLAARGLD